VELSAFAERVLMGGDLQDKLLQADVVLDRAPARRVRRPARSAALAIASKAAHAPLPRRQQLDDPAARAALLHSFANHELLATELLAAALLAFPDAPDGWRLGVLKVLRDEQRHLALYLSRLDALGLELGALPLSGFFWDACADAPSPMDVMCRLSLVFEQANLDFARTFGAWFREAGDLESAAVLDQVYADEVGHVRHGLGWLRRWKPPGWSDWDAWVARLQLPLSPSRARGLGFHAESRRAVGFDDDLIERLTRWRRSRGRPPVVYHCNPLCEIELHGTPARRLQALAADLALVPVALARRDDVVLVPAMPSAAWRDAWVAAGQPLPELHALADGLSRAAFPHPRVAALQPWGWSPTAHATLAPLVSRSAAPPPRPDPQTFSKAWSLPLRRAALEALRAEWADALVSSEDLGVVARSPGELDAAVRARSGRGAVLKAPWGSAGHGATRLQPGADPAPALRWGARALAAQGAVVVEPLHDRIADLSLHLDLGPDRATVAGWTRFWTDSTGRFRAASGQGPMVDLPVAARRLLVGDGRDPRRLDRVARALRDAVGPALRVAGVRGPVGIDAMVVQRPDGSARLHPLVEINPRLTMGRVALALGERSAPGRAVVLALPTSEELGGSDPAAGWARLAAGWPTAVRDGRLSAGLVALGDPAAARGRLPIWGVGDAATALLRAVAGQQGG
jgi:uncharacterized ferritin-like protein (DUF455 family)